MAAPHRRHWSIAALLLFTAVPLSIACAQEPSPPELVEDVRAAIARLGLSRTAAHRFTNFDLAHNQNRSRKGKLYSDTTLLYEDTWIADLPYKRLVEVGGRPLAGKDLEKEQRRYDTAVHDQVALDEAARARLIHERLMDAGLDLAALTSPAYRLTQLRHETLDGRDTVVLEATPYPSPSAAAPNHYLLWISPDDPTLLRLTFESLVDGPSLLRGSHGQKDFLLLDGTSLPSHITVHALVVVGHDPITVDTEHTYTRYRRFTVTTHILSSDPQPPPAAPQPPSAAGPPKL